MEWYIKPVGMQKWVNMDSSMRNLDTRSIVVVYSEHYECVTVISDNEFFATTRTGRVFHLKRMFDVE